MKECIDSFGSTSAGSLDLSKTPETWVDGSLRMSASRRPSSWQLKMALALGIGSAIAFSGNPTLAQITPDATLGTESSVVSPNVDVRNLPADLIEGGATRGANLFHSFSDFNVGEGLRVYFANPTGIENILSRVTGSNLSNILGTLGVDGGANLFLLNPNGIIFGENARLDIAGSFVASTANSLVFENGVEFSATNPQTPPLLTINVPIGLQYGRQQSGSLVNAGNLAVGQQQNLTLVGGTVAMTGQLSAPGGQISVVAVPSESLVQLGQAGEFLSVSPTSNPQSTTPDALSLAELLNSVEYDTGLTVTPDGQIEIIESGTQIAADIGTTIISGSLNASESSPEQIGGTVQVLGDKVGLFDNARIDVSGDAGGGTVLIGGDFQGRGAVPNALRTFIGPNATINADALTSGDGGRVIVWADEVTGFYGNISDRGGVESGNGGFVEVSGKNDLIFRGTVDGSALYGNAGTLLLDPVDIIIANGAGDSGADGTNTFQGDNSGLAGSILSAPLSAVNDTAPTTIFESELEGLARDTNIVLQATNDITINDLADDLLNFAIGTGSITFTADADNNGVGSFVMQDSALDTLKTNGREITISGASLTFGNVDTFFDFDTYVGDQLATAQVISTSPGVLLNTISGGFSGTNDVVDLFQIYLTGGATFSASTVGLSTVDTQLFLFDSNGFGVYGNDK